MGGGVSTHVASQPHVYPQEEGIYLTYFALERAPLLLREVYGDFPHHNDGSHLDGGVLDDALWQQYWHRRVAVRTETDGDAPRTPPDVDTYNGKR